MSGLITRRNVIKGLFVAPAIITAANIMPIKAIEKFTLSDFSPDKSKWVLVGSADDNMWMKNDQFELYHKRFDMKILKTMFLDPPIKHKNAWGEQVKVLSRVYQTRVITAPLPSSMIAYSDKLAGSIELSSWGKV